MMGRMARRLNETENMLWSLGQHQHLASTMGSIAILERSPDEERVVTTVEAAVATISGLQERVRAAAFPLGSPEWVVDTDFDLDHHLRFLRLPANSSLPALHRLAVQILDDPFDLTRPLWQITLVGGLRGGRAAMVTKVHHAIADGQRAFELAGGLLEFTADHPPPEPVDLHDALAALAESETIEGHGLGDVIRRGAEQLVGLVNDVAGSLNDPKRVAGVGAEAVTAARAMSEHAPDPARDPSPLWARRSRNRRYHAVSAPMAELQSAARRRGVSLNDLFVAASADAAVRHHDRHDTTLEAISVTVVISTRTPDDGDASGQAQSNAVVPVAIDVPGTGSTIDDRLLAIREQVKEKREAIGERPDLLATLGGLAGLVPSAVIAGLAMDQAARVDLATSNLPGPPIPVWFAGQRIRSMSPVGPVAGTAMNLTLLSFDGTAQIGVHLDPAAVADGEAYVDDLVSSLRDLGVSARTSR